MLFLAALRYGLEIIPSTFVDSFCAKISQGIIWIFYDSIIQPQAIEFLEEFILLLKGIFYLGLDLVHLIN